MAIYKRAKSWHMDVMINGVRYRESLDTTDKREASALEKKRIAEIQAGKGASKSGKDFARKPLRAASDTYLDERKPHTAPRTQQLERNLSTPLRRFFAEKPLMRIRAEDITNYQRERRKTGISGRTLNMEIGLLRKMMKRGKVWNLVAEDVRLDRENTRPIAKVLTDSEKRLLFETAASKDAWLTAYCAAVLAVNTTCRGIELKHTRWQDVDLFERRVTIRRSKTEAGRRLIPLNNSALSAFSRLRQRADALGTAQPDHYVFPACERLQVDPTKPQQTWRTAWRSLVKEAGKRAAEEAAKTAVQVGIDPVEAGKKAAASFARFRFHDLRHQAITELAEKGAPDATLMALAGHLSREMMEHYSHVRMDAKREATDLLDSGLVKPQPEAEKAPSEAVN